MVSVVLPVFNGKKYLRLAIESVLDQDHPSIEFLIINDGSTDCTRSIAEEFEKKEKTVRLLHHPNHMNRGVSYSRALGVSTAAGKYIAFLDADDIFEDNKLSRQVSILEERPEVVLAHSDVTYIDYEGKQIAPKNWFNIGERYREYKHQESDEFLLRCRICNPSVMLRSEILDGVTIGHRQIFQFEDWVL